MEGHTVLKLLIGLLAIVFFGNQLYSSLYKPLTTESAVYYDTSDGLNITGLIIREEAVVTCDTPGVFHFVTGDGTRVSKNGIIADIYDSEAASLTVSRIDSVKAQIEDITTLQSHNNLEAEDLDLINGKVSEALNGLITDTSAGNFSAAEEGQAKLLSTLNRRQIATGTVTDFSAQLAALNSELATLNGSLPAAKGNVRADRSGYFVSMTDGYEGVLTVENLDAVTPEFVAGLKPAPASANAIGKIVSDYEWYIAAQVSLNDSLKYKAGQNVIIKTTVKTNPRLPASVKQINISQSGEYAVIIFSCSQMDSELALMRMGPMTVVSTTYSGLRVEKRALRVRAEDSKTGVYVLNGMTISFVPVNVIYTNELEEYIIIKQEKSNEKVLRLYDEVVVKGKNLYDGKIVG